MVEYLLFMCKVQDLIPGDQKEWNSQAKDPETYRLKKIKVEIAGEIAQQIRLFHAADLCSILGTSYGLQAPQEVIPECEVKSKS